MKAEGSPIIILGMHRSGTSLLAHALSECGLYLGSGEHFFQAHETDNPEGYWEDVRGIDINDRVLAVLGGTDQRPPAFPAGWAADPRLDEAYKLADEFVRSLEGHGAWGWKDPRNMLTLPFWLTRCPSAKLLLIWRHPVEVGLSIARRLSHFDPYYVPTLRRSIDLWTIYNRTALNAAEGRSIVVTTYGRLLDNAAEELPRLCAQLGLGPSNEALQKAAEYVRTDKDRLQMGADIMEEPFMPSNAGKVFSRLNELCPLVAKDSNRDLLSIYRELMEVSIEQLAAQAAQTDGLFSQLHETNRRAKDTGDLRGWIDTEIDNLRNYFDHQSTKWQAEGDKWRHERDFMRMELDRQKVDCQSLQERNRELEQKCPELQQEKDLLEGKCQTLEKQVADIMASRSFRIARKLTKGLKGG